MVLQQKFHRRLNCLNRQIKSAQQLGVAYCSNTLWNSFFNASSPPFKWIHLVNDKLLQQSPNGMSVFLKRVFYQQIMSNRRSVWNWSSTKSALVFKKQKFRLRQQRRRVCCCCTVSKRSCVTFRTQSWMCTRKDAWFSALMGPHSSTTLGYTSA